jgi:hypothetical protein
VGLFDAHRDRVVLATCDGRDATTLQPPDPTTVPLFDLTALTAVFCNYVLDVLPAAIARRSGDRTEEFHVRTVLHQEDRLFRSAPGARPDSSVIAGRLKMPLDVTGLH